MPKPKEYEVELTDDERARLVAFTAKGIAAARELRRARILLLAAEDRLDAEVAGAVGCCPATVARVRRRYAEAGVEAALRDRPRPGAAPLLDGKGEAFLVALACADPPEGEGGWTMQLLADRLVELEMVPDITDEAIRLLLKRTSSSRGARSSG
jgi:transposase